MKAINAWFGAAALLALSQAAEAAPVQWTVGSGGNDHWYEYVATPGTYSQAETGAAATIGGYLATITSTGENAFITGLLTPDVAAAYLGGTDTATEGTWVWGTLEPFSYTNWTAGEPNDSGGEDYLSIYGAFAVALWGGDRPIGSWNDVNADYQFGYVVEYNVSPVPLPAALPLFGAGLAAFGVFARKRRRMAA